MSFALGLGVALSAFAALQRWRQREPISLDAVVLVAAGVLAGVGLVATLLAWVDALSPGRLAAAVVAAGLALVPWRRPASPRPIGSTPWRGVAEAVLVLGVAATLRWPPMDYALAGRDQGTYLLRAEHTARTSSIDFVDTVVAQATTTLDRSGAGDIAGLYPRRGEPWRDDVYEAGYRPGWYLADRERGRVVPQFLHLHPMLMTVALWCAPQHGGGALLWLEGVLAVAALLCVARQLLPARWSMFAAIAYAISPLGTWVHRNSLTEALTGLLTLCAVLALLRARGRDDDRGLLAAAAFLGTTAWVRGNAWITAPVVLATLWLLPVAPRRHRATAVFVALLLGAVLVHATTVFPYLHDELARQFSAFAQPSPANLVLAAGGGLVAWWSADELVFGPRARWPIAAALTRVRAALPALGGLALAGALAVWAWRAAGAIGPPHARLDALLPGLGPVLLVPAAVGIAAAVWRWRARTAVDVWLAAVALLVAATCWAYAARNLPKFGLYYYGRYLVPELLPLACLGAGFALARLDARVGTHRWARPAVLAVGLAGIGAIAWPLLVTPQTRLREFEGAGRIVDALAAHVPADAIVIAGGEGWHHGHTFNQVAGALAMRHGRQVMPYHTREAAYATLHELLVAGPAARGEAPPPVFLLVNEATHALGGQTVPVAALDDLLPPPFTARSAVLLELFTDRLTPTADALPTAVTRDVLRMGLLEVVVDPARAPVRVFFDGDAARREGGGDVPTRVGSTCLDPAAALEIHVPPALAAATASFVLVAAPGASALVDGWRVSVDGEARSSRSVGLPARARDSLGPFVVDAPPQTITIRAGSSSRRADDDACPHGALAELRLLGPDTAVLDTVTAQTLSFAPGRDLGHAVTPARWVSGRGLSRYRPGVGGDSELHASSLALRPGARLAFAPEPQAERPHDVVVNLTSSRVGPEARVRIFADDIAIAEIDPPDVRERSWQSPPVTYVPRRHATRWRLELVDAGADDVVWVRDIGLFSRAP